jgi:hypothetical protein
VGGARGLLPFTTTTVIAVAVPITATMKATDTVIKPGAEAKKTPAVELRVSESFIPRSRGRR